MKKQYLITILSIATAAALSACSGSGSSYTAGGGSTSKGGDISGFVGASNINNALVHAVPTDVQGQPARTEKGDKYEGTIKHTSDGSYSLTFASEHSDKAMVFIAISPEKPALQRCELVGGCSVDATNTAYKDCISIKKSDDSEGTFRLTAGIPHAKPDLQVSINWITTLAADIAYTSYHDVNWDGDEPAGSGATAGTGMFTALTINTGNAWLAKQLNLPDIIALQPIAPSKISAQANSAAGALVEGIYYGALLAGGQQLASEQNVTEAKWLSQVVSQQRDLFGQLYFNNNDDTFSLCALYGAAEDVLASNIKQQAGVPAAANDALAKIKDAKQASCAKENGARTNVNIKPDEAWQDRFKLAEEFLTDLDQRLGNFKGEVDGTCNPWSASPQKNCTASFYDPEVVKRTDAYFNDTFEPVIEQAIKKALPDILKGVLAFTHEAGIKDGTTFKTDKGLTLTLDLASSVKSESYTGKYNAFDFRLSGTQTFDDGIKLEYKTRKGPNSAGIEVEEHSRLRVVYDDAYELPPATKVADANLIDNADAEAVEPLGFDLQLVKVDLPNQGQGGKGLTFMSQLKMIGVKPIYVEGANYHYNFTEIDFNFGDVLGEVTSGEYKGELRHTDVIFSARSTNAPNYYSVTVWPEEADFFGSSTADAIVNSDEINGLFTYTLKENIDVIYQVQCLDGKLTEDGKCAGNTKEDWRKSDYFQLLTKGLGANRFELFTDEDKDGKVTQTLRKCSVAVDEDNELLDDAEINKVCTAAETVKGAEKEGGGYELYDLVTDLLNKENDFISAFAIPGYGLYEVQFDKNSNNEIVADDNQRKVEGKRIAGFRQGIDRMSLQITQALDDAVNSDGTATRKPSSITKINFNKQTNNDWEVALSTGYNFDYLIGPLPSGEGTQGLYTSFFIKDGAAAKEDESKERYVTELSSLQVFRGGVELAGKNSASYTATSSRTHGYFIDENDAIHSCNTDLAEQANGCRQDAIAYLSFQGFLLGVVREEREGRYIARLSNGKLLELNNLSNFNYQQALPVKLPFVSE